MRLSFTPCLNTALDPDPYDGPERRDPAAWRLCKGCLDLTRMSRFDPSRCDDCEPIQATHPSERTPGRETAEAILDSYDPIWLG